MQVTCTRPRQSFARYWTEQRAKRSNETARPKKTTTTKLGWNTNSRTHTRTHRHTHTPSDEDGTSSCSVVRVCVCADETKRRKESNQTTKCQHSFSSYYYYYYCNVLILRKILSTHNNIFFALSLLLSFFSTYSRTYDGWHDTARVCARVFSSFSSFNFYFVFFPLVWFLCVCNCCSLYLFVSVDDEPIRRLVAMDVCCVCLCDIYTRYTLCQWQDKFSTLVH